MHPEQDGLLKIMVTLSQPNAALRLRGRPRSKIKKFQSTSPEFFKTFFHVHGNALRRYSSFKLSIVIKLTEIPHNLITRKPLIFGAIFISSNFWL